MKATAKHKVVTSGRLTGGTNVAKARRLVTPAAQPEPAYSLYSTESEDQVTSLHKGLDRCAALLSDILQAEKRVSPSPSRAAAGRTLKSRPSTSLGKKSMKKLTKKTVQKTPQSSQCNSTTPKRAQKFTAPPPHMGVKLHPPRRPTPQKAGASPSICPTKPHTHTPSPQPQSSVLLSVLQSSSQPGRKPFRQTECNDVEEETVPVRDTDNQLPLKSNSPHVLDGSVKLSNACLESGGNSETPQVIFSCTEKEVKERTAEYLLGQLKTLIAGQGSVAENLLSRLEEVMSSPVLSLSDSSLNVQRDGVSDLSSLHRQNIQLQREVMILNQRLMEKEMAGIQGNTETLYIPQVTAVMKELTAAQSRLQELQHDLKELREALHDTQDKLKSQEAHNKVITTDLEAARSRLVDVEREKNKFSILAQQRLEEMENLKRMLQSQKSPDCPPTMIRSVLTTPRQTPSEHIAHYLRSLSLLGSTHADQETRGHSHDLDAQAPPVHHCHGSQATGQQLDSTLSQCDTESELCNWSMRSDSTFDTRDEVAFKDGLAALDASIDSLWKNLQLELRR